MNIEPLVWIILGLWNLGLFLGAQSLCSRDDCPALAWGGFMLALMWTGGLLTALAIRIYFGPFWT